ncbi:MAG: nucleotidyltransferase domain-containing protein [Candidatus Nanohaloarchaea archaeon]|nr:nucleotidyltransferase domain-containing protein [Candidatus Nanohaloarchaea archaeon]
MDKNLKAYASAFASFLIDQVEVLEKIDQIVLYGSVARGTADKESDVDIFVDTTYNLEDEIDRIKEEFYSSRRCTLFRSKGITNKISVKTGKLEEWESIHASISSTGIVLWGDFKAEKLPGGAQHSIIFYWEKTGDKRTSFLNKLYGYSTEDREIKGMLEKWGGKKIGKSSVLIPIEHKDDMIKLLKKYNIDARNIEVFTTD